MGGFINELTVVSFNTTVTNTFNVEEKFELWNLILLKANKLASQKQKTGQVSSTSQNNFSIKINKIF